MGANLKAPQTNEQGNEFWSYSLLKYIRSGDIVYHYHRPQQAIIAKSVAIGEIWEDDIVWAARGLSSRSAGIIPHTCPGWYVGLESFASLEQPVTLELLRSKQSDLLIQRDQLTRSVNEPLYFPFEISNRRPLRPMQGYLFKLPLFFVELFPQLEIKVTQRSLREGQKELGSTYRAADETTSVGQRDPFSVDPALVERALRSHATTQNALAAYLTQRGVQPRSPRSDEPNFDLAWTLQSATWVAEIKSLTESNEEKQLRLGLGQLLRYRQLLRSRGSVQAVLVTERQPIDLLWHSLCEELDIILLYPDNWQQKLPI